MRVLLECLWVALIAQLGAGCSVLKSETFGFSKEALRECTEDNSWIKNFFPGNEKIRSKVIRKDSDLQLYVNMHAPFDSDKDGYDLDAVVTLMKNHAPVPLGAYEVLLQEKGCKENKDEWEVLDERRWYSIRWPAQRGKAWGGAFYLQRPRKERSAEEEDPVAYQVAVFSKPSGRLAASLIMVSPQRTTHVHMAPLPKDARESDQALILQYQEPEFAAIEAARQPIAAMQAVLRFDNAEVATGTWLYDTGLIGWKPEWKTLAANAQWQSLELVRRSVLVSYANAPVYENDPSLDVWASLQTSKVFEKGDIALLDNSPTVPDTQEIPIVPQTLFFENPGSAHYPPEELARATYPTNAHAPTCSPDAEWEKNSFPHEVEPAQLHVIDPEWKNLQEKDVAEGIESAAPDGIQANQGFGAFVTFTTVRELGDYGPRYSLKLRLEPRDAESKPIYRVRELGCKENVWMELPHQAEGYGNAGELRFNSYLPIGDVRQPRPVLVEIKLSAGAKSCAMQPIQFVLTSMGWTEQLRVEPIGTLERWPSKLGNDITFVLNPIYPQTLRVGLALTYLANFDSRWEAIYSNWTRETPYLDVMGIAHQPTKDMSYNLQDSFWKDGPTHISLERRARKAAIRTHKRTQVPDEWLMVFFREKSRFEIYEVNEDTF